MLKIILNALIETKVYQYVYINYESIGFYRQKLPILCPKIKLYINYESIKFYRQKLLILRPNIK